MSTKLEFTAEWILKETIQMEFCKDESMVFFDIYGSGMELSFALLALEKLGIEYKGRIYTWGYNDNTETWERVFVPMKVLEEKCLELHKEAIRIRQIRTNQGTIQPCPPEMNKIYKW